jgi:cell division protein FtsB
MNLSIDDLIHIRESIDRHLRLLEDANPLPASPAKELKDKKIQSLSNARREINQEISDLQFEADRNVTSFIHDTDPD